MLISMSEIDAVKWSDQGVNGLSPTGTVTLLWADIEGSTRLWETLPEEMTAAVENLDRTLADLVGVHRGVRPVEQGEGDSFVVAFTRASDAVACALALQRAPLSPILLRIGVHTGEVPLRDEGNYIGSTIDGATDPTRATPGYARRSSPSPVGQFVRRLNRVALADAACSAPVEVEWLNHNTFQWKPTGFWPAHSHITVTLGGFKTDNPTGAAVVGVASISAHTFTVSIDGQVARVMPASMGKPSRPTPVGSYSVLEKDRSVEMDSRTIGIPLSSPEGYDIIAQYAERITSSGVYVHSAPWSVELPR